MAFDQTSEAVAVAVAIAAEETEIAEADAVEDATAATETEATVVDDDGVDTPAVDIVAAEEDEAEDAAGDGVMSVDAKVEEAGNVTAQADDSFAAEASEAPSKKRKLNEDDKEDPSRSLATPGAKKASSVATKKSKRRKKSIGDNDKDNDKAAEDSVVVPFVGDLEIPYRNTRRVMKLQLDPLTIVQQEAAMVATYAAEMFVQKLAQDGLVVAKKRGRHTVRYEDIAEARANDHNLNFLDILFP